MAGYTSLDNAICAVESETTYGTDAFSGAPNGDQVIAFRNLVITPQMEAVENDRMTATVTGECHGIGYVQNNVTWEMPLIGSSDAGELPPGDALLKACNMKATVVADTSVTYTINTANSQTDTPSATVVMYQRSVEDATGKRILARGVRSTLMFNFTVGQEAYMGGEGVGLYDPIPATFSALPTLPTSYNGDQCGWIVNTMAVTVGATTYPCEAVEFATNFNTEVIKTGDATSGGQAGHVLLTKGKSGNRVGGSLTLADGSTALQDMITKAYAGTKASLTVVLTKGARTITFSFPAIQFGVFEDQSPRYNVPFFAVRATGTAGDNDFSIAYT